MMELPEAVTLAAQMNGAVRGKVIEAADCGNSPHKFAFYQPSQEAFAKVAAGKTVGDAVGIASFVSVDLAPGFALTMGDGGVRLLLHEAGAPLPKKHHLALRFTDGTCLTAAVAGWGFFGLIEQSELAGHASRRGLSPIGEEFTYARFREMLADCASAGKDSVKKFLISTGGIAGIGNGYLHDIAFRAGVHPRRKVADVTGKERRRLYHAVTKTMREAVARGGRDTEPGLDGSPGGHVPLLDKRAKGRPCPECGTAIEKIQFLGGACYFCPACQT